MSPFEFLRLVDSSGISAGLPSCAESGTPPVLEGISFCQVPQSRGKGEVHPISVYKRRALTRCDYEYRPSARAEKTARQDPFYANHRLISACVADVEFLADLRGHDESGDTTATLFIFER